MALPRLIRQRQNSSKRKRRRFRKSQYRDRSPIIIYLKKNLTKMSAHLSLAFGFIRFGHQDLESLFCERKENGSRVRLFSIRQQKVSNPRLLKIKQKNNSHFRRFPESESSTTGKVEQQSRSEIGMVIQLWVRQPKSLLVSGEGDLKERLLQCRFSTGIVIKKVQTFLKGSKNFFEQSEVVGMSIFRI